MLLCPDLQVGEWAKDVNKKRSSNLQGVLEDA